MNGGEGDNPAGQPGGAADEAWRMTIDDALVDLASDGEDGAATALHAAGTGPPQPPVLGGGGARPIIRLHERLNAPPRSEEAEAIAQAIISLHRTLTRRGM